VTKTDDQPSTTSCAHHGSNESAAPILDDHTISAHDWLPASYGATPTTKREHERIDAIMREAVGEADPSPCAEKSWKYKQPLMV